MLLKVLRYSNFQSGKLHADRNMERSVRICMLIVLVIQDFVCNFLKV